ncbi:MAG TPA: hypothetical protein PKD37_01735 [Oligoflexia bacterium]|nr:hypothetical protein [Oligoflexia bacterium]HMP26698.1 hypothetical protein [Oligoflexia bacterium]
MAAICFSFGVFFLLLSLYSFGYELLITEGLSILPTHYHSFILGFLLITIGITINWRSKAKKTLTDLIQLNYFALCFVLFFLTDFPVRPYSISLFSTIRGELILATCLVYFLLAAISARGLWIFTAIASVSAIYALTSDHAGQILFSDDLSTFWFRLELLKQHFPRIPFYYTLWNGGIDQRDFFATGVLNFFIIFSPIIYFFDLISSYNFLIAILIFVIQPLSMGLAAKITSGSGRASAIAAILSFATSLHYYRWALKYGTLGFATSLALLPCLIAIAVKSLQTKSISWKQSVLLVILAKLVFVWAPMGIVFVLWIILSLPKILSLLKLPQFKFITICIVLFTVSWVAILLSISKINKFISHTSITSKQVVMHSKAIERDEVKLINSSIKLSIKRSLKIIRTILVGANPLLLIMFIPGILLLSSAYKTFYALTLPWLLLIGGFFVQYAPHLELERLITVMITILAVPSAIAIDNLISNCLTKTFWRACASCCFAYTLLSPLLAMAVVKNRSIEQFNFTGVAFFSLKSALEKAADGSRALFTGCVIHELDGVHLAPLSEMTKIPLIASSYAHNIWWYKQIFPEEYLKPEGDPERNKLIDRYLNLYNVGLILAHEEHWKNYLNSRKEDFRYIGRHGHFALYKRENFQNSYFLEGNGELLDQYNNKVIFKPNSESIVLKFNYFPFLKSTHCKLKPFKVSERVTLISAENCPIGETVEISSISPLKRIAHGLPKIF